MTKVRSIIQFLIMILMLSQIFSMVIAKDSTCINDTFKSEITFEKTNTNYIEIKEQSYLDKITNSIRKYESHIMNTEDIKKLQKSLGIWQPNVNYGLFIDEHGTGLIPPTLEEYSEMIGNIEVVDRVSSIEFPSNVDHSLSPYFPEVRSQGSSLSCTSFAVTYYAHGFYQAREHDWNNASEGDNTQLLSPAWTYNIINKGLNDGSSFYRNFRVLETIGAPTWAKMPFYANDYLSWGGESAWREAPKYRAVWYKQTDAQNIEVIKSWVNDGYICPISLDANEYLGLGEGDDTITSSEYNSTSHNHANAVVGYDDTKVVDGEIGAFKVVNSWGSNWGNTKGGRNNSGGWNGSGFYWFTYKAFAKLVQPVYVFQDKVDHEPQLLATWTFEGNCSKDAFIRIRLGKVNNVELTRDLYRNAGKFNYPKFMCLDITEFANGAGINNIYLQIGNGVNRTNVTSFNVELYENGYYPDGANSIISRDCTEVPKCTPNYYNSTCDGFYIRINSPQKKEYCQGSVQIQGTAKSAIVETIFQENFEETFPMGWIVGDYDNNSGLDYWGNSTERKRSGLKSGWCAGVKELIFQEDFDNQIEFMTNWEVISENITNIKPWNTTNLNYSFVYGGEDFGVVCDSQGSENITEWLCLKNGFSTLGYDSIILEFQLDFNKSEQNLSSNNDYAQILFANGTTYPNYSIFKTWKETILGIQRFNFSIAAGEDLVYIAFKYHGEFGNHMFIDDIKIINNISNNQYDNNMNSIMYRIVNLTKYDQVKLSYDYWIDSEYDQDKLSLVYQVIGVTNWQILTEHTSSSMVWKSNYLSIPKNVSLIGFNFKSDLISHNFEGAYIDNIKLTGYVNISSVSLKINNGPTLNVNGLAIWSKTINSLTEPDGFCTITASIKYPNYGDIYDNIQISIDNLAPEPFSPTAVPGDWSTIRQPVIFFDTSDQGSYIKRYEMKIDDGMFSTQKSPITLPSLVDGIHDITIRAIDVLDHHTDGIVKVYIDTTKPLSFKPVISPSGWTNNIQPTIYFNTSDPLSGIDHYMISINDGNFSNQTSPYTLPVLPEGIHTIKVRAFDKAGNYNDGTVNTFIDLNIPETFVANILPSTWTRNNRPTITFSATDNLSKISNFKVRIDNGGYTEQTSPYKLPVLSDGVHNITVQALDNAGNYIEKSVFAYIDTNPPRKFSPITEPLGWTKTVPEVTFETIDNTSGIDHYELLINNKLIGSVESPYKLPELNDGKHTISVRAYDLAGNFQEESINIYLDTIKPKISEVFPLKGSWLNKSNLNLTWRATDDRAGVKHCLVKIDDGIIITIKQISDLDFYLLVDGLSNGKHEFNITIIDQAGNDFIYTSEFNIDTIPPLIVIKSPEKNRYLNQQNVNLSWLSEDYGSGLNYSEISLNDGAFKYTGTEQQYIFTGLLDGYYKTLVRSWDVAGNSWTEEHQFYVDLTGPNLTILEPSEGAVIKNSELLIQWLGTDANAGIDHYEIKLDDEKFINIDKKTAYTYTSLTPGEHMITLKAVDGAQNINEIDLTFVVDLRSDDDGVENVDYTGLIAAIVIIIVILNVVIILFLRRKKKI